MLTRTSVLTVLVIPFNQSINSQFLSLGLIRGIIGGWAVTVGLHMCCQRRLYGCWGSVVPMQTLESVLGVVTWVHCTVGCCVEQLLTDAVHIS